MTQDFYSSLRLQLSSVDKENETEFNILIDNPKSHKLSREKPCENLPSLRRYTHGRKSSTASSRQCLFSSRQMLPAYVDRTISIKSPVSENLSEDFINKFSVSIVSPTSRIYVTNTTPRYECTESFRITPTIFKNIGWTHNDKLPMVNLMIPKCMDVAPKKPVRSKSIDGQAC